MSRRAPSPEIAPKGTEPSRKIRVRDVLLSPCLLEQYFVLAILAFVIAGVMALYKPALERGCAELARRDPGSHPPAMCVQPERTQASQAPM